MAPRDIRPGCQDRGPEASAQCRLPSDRPHTGRGGRQRPRPQGAGCPDPLPPAGGQAQQAEAVADAVETLADLIEDYQAWRDSLPAQPGGQRDRGPAGRGAAASRPGGPARRGRAAQGLRAGLIAPLAPARPVAFLASNLPCDARLPTVRSYPQVGFKDFKDLRISASKAADSANKNTLTPDKWGARPDKRGADRRQTNRCWASPDKWGARHTTLHHVGVG